VTSFTFRAARDDGERVTGVLEAPTTTAAVSMLVERGLVPVRVRERTERTRQKHSPEQLAVVFSGIAALLEAGLPLDRVLEATIDGAPVQLRPMLAEVNQQVREGKGFASALETSRAIPDFVAGMLRAGEAQGRLATATRRVSTELNRQAELRSELRAALTYPAFLCAAGFVSVILIVGFVLPRFASLLSDLGQALPASTRFLLAVSSAVKLYGLFTMIAAATGAWFASALLKRDAVRTRVHQELLGLPVIGSLRHELATARACRSLAALLDSGVPLLSSLELIQSGCSDAEVSSRLARVRSDVSEGARLGLSLARHRALTTTALQLARFGDESGRLGAFFAQAATLEDDAARRALRRLVAFIEPALIVGFGVIVAFVAAALLQAVYSVRPAGF
jgi:general secretion pathway protein F